MSLRDYIGIGKIFEGVIIINLDTRIDRWSLVSTELAKMGINDVVERLPGIVHRYGMVGCSLSHLECVKIAKIRGWKSVLILEDDIKITEHFNECCDKTLDQLSNTNWGVFHFGAMLMNICKQVDNNLLRIGYNWAAHAVAIHEKVYDFIISNYDWSYSETDTTKPWGGHYPFDGFVNKNVYDAGFEIYSAYPLLITQRPDFSDTWGYHRDYKDLIEQSYDIQISREVGVLIVSKNRPMQLHATLDSYFKYARDSGNAKINVLYTFDDKYKDGYDIIQKEYKDRVIFIKESDYTKDVIKVVSSVPYILFLVDDVVFYRPFKLSDGCKLLTNNDEVLSFSYRLGGNITYSYINNINTSTPKEYDIASNVVLVDWTNKLPYTDFGYPFEISSSMYRSSDVLRMMSLSDSGWASPNYYELTGTEIVRSHVKDFGKFIATYMKSVSVCIPLNRVQNQHLNRCVDNPIYSPESLLRLYEGGMMLNFDDVNEYWSSNSVHVELSPSFKLRVA